MSRETPILDTDALIDAGPIGPLQIGVLALGVLVLVTDGFDTQVLSYVAPQIAAELHLSSAMLGITFSAALVGSLAGYLLLAPLAGRFGPKRVVALSLAGIGLCSMLSASAGSTEAFILWRFMTGLGIGGSQPGAVALAGEFCPKRRRATFITFVYIGFSIGQILAGTAADHLLGPYGWRVVLWVGAGLPLLLAAVVQLLQPESIEYLVNAGGDRRRVLSLLRRLAPGTVIPETARLVSGGAARRAVSVIELFRSGRASGTLLIWTAMFMNLTLNYFIQNWLTKLLTGLAVPQSRAIFANTMITWGGILPAFVIGPLMERFGAYRAIAGVFVASAVICVLIGLAMTPPLVEVAVMVTVFAVGFCLSSGQKSLGALAVQFYPIALRSTGLGWLFGMGRFGGVLGAVAPGFLLQRGWHPAALFYLTTVAPLCGVVATVAMGRYYEGGGPPRPVSSELGEAS